MSHLEYQGESKCGNDGTEAAHHLSTPSLAGMAGAEGIHCYDIDAPALPGGDKPRPYGVRADVLRGRLWIPAFAGNDGYGAVPCFATPSCAGMTEM